MLLFVDLEGQRDTCILLCASPTHIHLHLWNSRWISFPTQDELHNPPADGIFKMEYTYSAYLKRLKYVFHNKLNCSWIQVGSHTGRKFAHLFGTFRGASATQNQKAADHKDLRQSALYTEDTEGLLELYKVQHDRPIECKGPENAKLVNE
jgi:hypothetical protein